MAENFDKNAGAIGWNGWREPIVWGVEWEREKCSNGQCEGGVFQDFRESLVGFVGLDREITMK